MKIPKALPQFEKFPALFLTSGEYEAHFHIASAGSFKLVRTIKMAPREEAKEKQAFVGHKAGMQSLSAVSHRGSYTEDLKKKFARKVHETIKDVVAEYKLEEIYFFAPKYVAKRILDTLDSSLQKKVRMQFYKEYTKTDPLELIKTFELEIEKIQEIATKTPKEQVLLS